jgi:hypothetical protein
VALGGEIDYRIDLVLVYDLLNQRSVADVTFDEFVIPMLQEFGKVLQIAGVR